MLQQGSIPLLCCALACALAADDSTNNIVPPVVVKPVVVHVTDAPVVISIPGSNSPAPPSAEVPAVTVAITIIAEPDKVALGSQCDSNATCQGNVQNSICDAEAKSCTCMAGFYESLASPGLCRLAPGFGEPCADVSHVSCRSPFVCNATQHCDCPSGYIQEFFQCIRDCPANTVPTFDGCLPARQLGEQCGASEQCVQSYAQCLHGQCQCIAGASRVADACAPVNQCPMGEPAVAPQSGALWECKADGLDACPKGHYCLFAQNKGICCPKIRMNCPIGKALEGHNCSTCPWHTHHCFSYVIGSYSDSMCCPNACPTTQPILSGGRCYPRSPFGGHCSIDAQCAGVANAVCRVHKGSGLRRCLCPEGPNFKNHLGRCIRQSSLGDNCTSDEECIIGTNTLCVKGVCTCYQRYMPEPPDMQQPLDDAAALPHKCIAEPSCPSASGVELVDADYVDCSHSPTVCGGAQFCRKWWFDGSRTFSLCCPLPSLGDYEAVCSPFRMRLILSNELEKGKVADFQDAQPLRCKLTRFSLLLQDSSPDKEAESATSNSSGDVVPSCPSGASCLFDPFSTQGAGICCRPDNTGNMLPPVASVPKVKPSKPVDSGNVDLTPNSLTNGGGGMKAAGGVRVRPVAAATDARTKTNMLR